MTEKKKHLVWPDLIFMEFLTAIALTIILIVWGLLANAPLLEIASPTRSENPSKAPWYFAGLQELLVYFDPWIAGVMIPAIIILCLMVVPYIDRNPRGNGEYTFSLRKLAIINFIFGFLMWLILIFTGYFLRGPNWQLYLPWESWGKVKEGGENLWSLNPEIGFICLIIYFGLGMMLPKLIKKDCYKKCGLVRYVIVMLSILSMYFVPIKIFLRLAFNIKYVLVTPWFNI
jgi:quinol-cytochrome oxidoreductase complex cytochrome b subunit